MIKKYQTHLENAARSFAVALAFFIPLSNTATSACAAGFLILALLSMDKNKFISLIKHPITIAILSFLAIYLLASTYSIGDEKNVLQSLRKMSRLLLIPLLFPLFTEERWRMRAMLGFLLAIIISIFAPLQAGLPYFKDPIFTSLFVAVAAYMLLNYSIALKKFRSITILLFILCVYYLFFICTGRTGQVIFFALYFLFCYKNFKREFKLQLLAALAISAIFIGSVLLPSSFSQRQTEAAHEVQTYIGDTSSAITTSSTGARLTFWNNALTLIKMKPVFGWGTGSFANAYKANINPEAAKNVYPVNPHNQYLLTAVETGVIGLLALLGVFISIALCFWCSKALDAQLGLGVMCAIAIGCLANSWLLDFASMFFFVTMAGVLAGAILFKSR